MKARFPVNEFEQFAQRLVEGTLSAILGGPVDLRRIALALARAIEDGQRDGSAPERLELWLHEADYRWLLAEMPDIIPALEDVIRQISAQAGLILSAEPVVSLHIHPQIARRRVEVRAQFAERSMETTQVRLRRGTGHQAAIKKLDAFLIVGGRRHISLDRPVMNIGRRADNDIVIDNPEVSRRHAQLRWRYGRYVIYDRGSRGGTRVNDVLVAECALTPGDVISLSTISLIYGEGSESRPRAKPRREDAPTLALKRDTKPEKSNPS